MRIHYHFFWLIDPSVTQTGVLQAPLMQCDQTKRAANNFMIQKLSKQFSEDYQGPEVYTTTESTGNESECSECIYLYDS